MQLCFLESCIFACLSEEEAASLSFRSDDKRKAAALSPPSPPTKTNDYRASHKIPILLSQSGRSELPRGCDLGEKKGRWVSALLSQRTLLVRSKLTKGRFFLINHHLLPSPTLSSSSAQLTLKNMDDIEEGKKDSTVTRVRPVSNDDFDDKDRTDYVLDDDRVEGEVRLERDTTHRALKSRHISVSLADGRELDSSRPPRGSRTFTLGPLSF